MNEKFAVNVVVPASLEMGYVNQGSTVFDQEIGRQARCKL